MAKSGRIDVKLNDAGLEALRPHFTHLLKDGTHFNCESVEQVGAFLRMRVVSPVKIEEGEDYRIDIEIPVGFVLYTIASGLRADIGFHDDAFKSR